MIIQDGTLVKIISLKGELVVSYMKPFLNQYAHIIQSENYGELKLYALKMINPSMQQLNIKKCW